MPTLSFGWVYLVVVFSDLDDFSIFLLLTSTLPSKKRQEKIFIHFRLFDNYASSEKVEFWYKMSKINMLHFIT